MASLEKMAKSLLTQVTENNLLIKSLLTQTLHQQEVLIEQNRALLAKTTEICTLLDSLRTPPHTPSD